MNDLVYKIVPAKLWREAEKDGVFTGAGIDRVDGYIHLSTASQTRQTAALHFKEGEDLLLVAIPIKSLGEALVFEPSRGGALFPHLFGDLALENVSKVIPLKRGADGLLIFPEEIL